MFHKCAKKRPADEISKVCHDSCIPTKIFVVKINTEEESDSQNVIEDLPIETAYQSGFGVTDSALESSDEDHVTKEESDSQSVTEDLPIETAYTRPVFQITDDALEKFEEQVFAKNKLLSIPNEEIFNLEKEMEVQPKKPAFSGWTANRHKLQFLEKWYEEFPFMDYDQKNNVMFCKTCRKYVNDWRKKSPFVVGTDNFRESMIKYHQRSLMHTECQELYDTLASEDSEAVQKDLYKDQLSHVFKSVYFIYKNKMPYTHFPQLCESQKREGTDFTVYTTQTKVVPLFGKFISMAFEKELAQKISHVPEFSLIIDGSFKRSIESHDLVYIKYIDGMIVQTAFLGVIDSSAKLHDSVYNNLNALFKKYCIEKWVDKVVYIMTDRSDNHMWLEGLIDLIKTMSPRNFVFEVQYLSHKVRFCVEVVQNHKTTSTFDALLWSIYCYCEKLDSSKRNFIHMNKVLDDIAEYYGGYPKNSYIALYYEALKAVESDWSDLVPLLEVQQNLLHLDAKVRKSSAKILSVIIRSSFICKMAVLLDIFSCVNDFALKLDREGLLPYDVHMLLDEVCADIEKAVNGEGSAVAEIEEELSAMPGYFRGTEIKDDSNMQQILPELKDFSYDLISYLKSIVDETFLEKCFIFNTSLWPEDEELETFGNSEFRNVFLELRGEEKHLTCALSEWISFKKHVVTFFPYEVRHDSKSVITKMVIDYEDNFPFVTSILRKIVLLDFECGEVKIGHHEMCLNKSLLRSVLSVQSLQTMMMISMYGPSLDEFDFSLALNLFLNSRHRKFRKKIIDKKMGYIFNNEEEEEYNLE